MCIEKMFVSDSYNIFSSSKPVQNIRARKCKLMHNELSNNAGNVGLKLNGKNQVLCVSSSKDCEQLSYCRSIALTHALSQLHVHACRPELASTEVARAN